MWKKNVPTVDEVRECQWWWNKSEDTEPFILQLDVDDDVIEVLEGIGFEPLNPNNWGEYWSPAIPPAFEE